MEIKSSGRAIKIDHDLWREFNEVERAAKYRADLAIENVRNGKRVEAEHLIDEIVDHLRQELRRIFIRITAP